MTEYCLGIEYLGKCSCNNAYDCQSVFGIGDALSAIALVLAFSQVLSPFLKFKIKRIFNGIYLSWFIAVLCIFVATILPYSPFVPWPIVGYPAPWELLSSILIVYGIAKLVRNFNNPLVVDEKNIKNLRIMAVNLIGSGDEGNAFDLANAYRLNQLTEIVRTAKLSASNSKQRSKYATEVLHLIRIFEDETFCKIVVTKDPGFAIVLFRQINSQHAYEKNIFRPLVQQLVRQAVLNTDSILYKEQQYGGLGTLNDFSKAAFSHSQFNESLTPLGGIHLVLEDEVTEDSLAVIRSAMNYQAEAYIKSGNFYNSSYTLHKFNDFFEHSSRLVYQLNKCSPESLPSSEKISELAEISGALSDIITIFESSFKTDLGLIEFYKSQPRTEDYSPYQYVANWMYELLASVSRTREYDQELRSVIIRPWLQIFSVTKPTVFQQEVQWRLIKMCEEQAITNFTDGTYPAITRPLLVLFGIFEDKDQSSTSELKKTILGIIRENFHSALKKNEKRTLDKLPSNVSFDRKGNRLIQKNIWGTEFIFELKRKGYYTT
jgi:hypothetical protein